MGRRGRRTIVRRGRGRRGGREEGRSGTGLFTSGVVSTWEGRQIALFFSGRQHAGENLTDVLAGVPRTWPRRSRCAMRCRGICRRELETIVAHCLAHGRRQFVDVAERFPEECRHVLESLAVIYRNDASPGSGTSRRRRGWHFHQAESGPTMDELHAWLVRQFDERLVEPNSALGAAISYMLKHWEKLTLFLRSARGAAGQQHLRAGLEEGHPAPQERPVLQDQPRRPCRRHVHEPDPHLPNSAGPIRSTT